MKRVEWALAATDELVAAARWYDSKIPGLGERFISVVDEAVRRIAAFPFAWNQLAPPIAKTRRTLLRPFSWRLVYEVTNSTVTVPALQHTRRKPAHNRRAVRRRAKRRLN